MYVPTQPEIEAHAARLGVDLAQNPSARARVARALADEVRANKEAASTEARQAERTNGRALLSSSTARVQGGVLIVELYYVPDPPGTGDQNRDQKETAHAQDNIDRDRDDPAGTG